MADRRHGRGRLSSIDLLPEEADEAVSWAFEQLRERERTQKDIHAEFNDRLAELDLGPISLSAFNRHSIRLAAMARRHQEARSIASTLVERLDPQDADQLTIAAAETIKMLVYELMEGDGITPKQTMELARALVAAESASQKPQARKREQRKAFEKEVDTALDRAVTEGGLSAERKAELRRDLLGVRS